MIDPVFVDTNVLVYALDSSQGDKQASAHQWLHALWKSRRGMVSVQVLQESYVTLTRKLRPGLSTLDARREVEAYLSWAPIVTTPDVLDRAWQNEVKFSLSWWDSLIVAAAQIGGARYLLTEYLQDGQELAGLRVVNPFKHTPESITAA